MVENQRNPRGGKVKTVLKSPVALLVAITLAIMLGAVAFGALVYSVVVPGEVTVLQAPTPSPTPTPTPTPTPAPTYALGIYSDPGGTVLLTQVQWGSVIQGGSNALNVWVKNLGNQPASVDVVMTPIAGLSLAVPQAPLALAPD